MKKLMFIVTGIVCMFAATATVSAKEKIVVNSEPSGAQIYVNGVNTGLVTPAVVHVANSKQVRFGFRKEGYDNGEVLIVKKKNYNGKKELPSEVSCRLNAGVYKKDPTIPAGAATEMVSRDAPGQTAMERTILRWYFDSDPRGARIYWRVISSIPDQVKNTNETYLMTTPFEETRSFNILGLTYENSRDVTIEIKVSRNGYFDQVKRFNARQALDQQEISGFFEMIKQDE